MAYSDNNNVPVNTENKDKFRNSATLLPLFFRTEANKKFLGATLDSLISKGQLEKINGFVGSRYAKASKPEDRFLVEPTSNRRRYNLLPSAVIRDDFDDRTEWLATYDDLVNQLDFFKAKTDNHDRLFSGKYYAWNPHLDFDKIANYRQYYWLPNGPSPVTITGLAEDSVSAFTVTNQNSQAWVFTPDGSSANPVIKLFRGATYKFELNSPGHPFYIKLARTTGNLDQYEEGITNNGAETGAVVFTVPKSAPDILYYTCGNHQEMQGIFEIKDAVDELNIDIPTEVLGKKEFTSSNGVVFTNGLKVNFTGDVTPITYKNKNFYVEGVGDKIKLLPVSEFDTPEGYSQNFDYEFDIETFDDTPYDDADSSPETPEYVSINRGSLDKNPWSRYNRWFHKEVIEKTAQYNNTVPVFDENQRAKRPIIEFKANTQLYNFAIQGIGNVDLIDTVTTDVFSEVEGQIGYYVDQIDLTKGMRVTFNADPDITVRGKIYEVDFVSHGGNSRLHLKEVESVSTGQGIVVTNGASDKGTSWYYNGSDWIKGQQKTTLNQAPLFELYDTVGVAFSDESYGVNSFLGNKLVSYKVGEGSDDTHLGFPLEYQNIANIGDIVFEFNWDNDSFVYNNGTTNVTQDTASGSVKINESLTVSKFEAGWSLVDEKLRQRIIQLNDTQLETSFIEITSITNPARHITAQNIIVEYAGNVLKPTTGFTTRSEGNKLFVDFVTPIPANVRVVCKILTDQIPTQFGHYEPAINLTNNSENNDLKTFTLGSISDHVQTIFQNDTRVTGKFNQTSNARDVKDLFKFGRRYVKNQSSLLPAIFGLVDNETNVIKSIRKNALDYNVFKQQFVEVFDTIEISGNPRDDVSDMLYKMALNTSPERQYFYSDMAGFGRSLTKTEYTVNAFEQQIFGIQSNFNISQISNRSVYVYFNGEHLINGKDYEFDSIDSTVTLLRSTTIGDTVVIYDYDTKGNIIPNTPTKLGLYPKFEPKIYIDDTYVTPTKVIQGHDGSKTVAYDDYRDDLLLELEKRIYNNIKVEYNRSVFDNNEFIPGAFRKNEYTRQEFNQVLEDDFSYWSNLYSIDTLTNDTSVEGELFSYNLSTGIDTVNGNQLPGYWKAIYKNFYDTDRPHTAPWEMLGYSEEPTWWEDRYGPAPYTKGNSILWNDIEKGFDYGTGKINSVYARPGLSKIIPVNDYGELLSPLQANLVNGFITPNLNNDWVFGDIGPAEYAWRSSSWYPYALQVALALTKPANYFTTQYDTSQNVVSINGNIVYKRTGKIIDFTDIKVHNLFYDNVRYFGSGYHVFVVDFLKTKDQNILEGYYNRLSNISMNLTYKTGAFVNKERLRVLLESSNPNQPDKSIFLPEENYEITFRKSNPIFTANISGIIVEKTDKGYQLKGYDKYSPRFKIYKPLLSQKDQAVNVGGTTAKFILWQEEKFYGIGQIVQYDGFYYRTNADHTSTTTFDQTKFSRLAELPLTGGASVQKPTRFADTITEIPYQIVLPNLQEVYNIILGYGKYLESIGFVFDTPINELGELSNWDLSGKEFLYWSTQNWSTGSVITLAPFARGITYKFANGQVDNVLDSFYEYSIYDASGGIISRKNISTIRESGIFRLSPKDTQQGIFNAQLNLVQKEHVLVFDDKSVFGDIIYDQEAGYRQERLKLIGFKTTEWDGDLYSPGFVFDEAKISPWAPYRDYNLGDVVKYKSKFYSSKSFIPGSTEFNYSDWAYLENTPKAELLPNLDFKISNFQDFYNLDTETFDQKTTELSQHLIGYQKRFYLDNLIQDSTAQYKFYQGYIKTKGTKNAIDGIGRLKIDDITTNVELDEEWAFKVGSYGSSSNLKEIEFVLNEKDNLDNPQAFDFVSAVTTNTSPGNNIQLLANKIAIKPIDYDNNPWPVTALSSQDGITSEYVNRLPVAGYPRIDDVPTTAFRYSDMLGSSIINQLDDSDLIWVAKDKDNDWNIYQLQSIPARVIQTDDIKTEFFDGEITLYTDIPHNLTLGQIISIKNFSEAVDNVYEVKSIPSTTSFKVAGEDSSNTLQDSTSGSILEFISNRITNTDDINNIKNVTKIEDGSLVYADNDGTGKWAVYQKNRAFKENNWGTPNLITEQKFGANIVTANQGRTIVVAAPEFSDEGQIYVLGREFNTGIETLQTTQGFSISANTSDDIVSNTGNPRLGTSLAISNDGSVLTAGAPTASNFKGADDSTYSEGFRVSIGDFTVGPSPYLQEGVVTLHTYDTEENLFKLNYVIGSSEPEDNAHFGTSVLVSNTKLLVGAPGKTNNQGKVYIYDKTVRPDGSTLDWDLSDHHTLSIPNSRDGDRFGATMTANADLSIIAVGATGHEEQGDDSTANKGAVFVYSLDSNNEYQLLQTISSATFNQIDSGDSFGYALDMSNDGTTLIISAPYDDANAINSGAVYYFKKTGDDSSQNLYTYQQTIFSPLKANQEQFGANISINEDGTGFAVWSQHGKNKLTTTFDKFTILEDSTLDETTKETVFDANSLKVIDENYASGTVYTYSLLNTKFVYGQNISSITTNEFDEFGKGLAYTGNSLVVGAPNAKDSNSEPIGNLFVYQKTGSGGWNKLRSQDDPVDPYKVQKSFTYNRSKNKVKDFLETIDPVKGKIAYLADAEIRYKTDVDPATYSLGTDNLNVRPTTAWTDNHVGEIWWDLSTASFIWYEQGDTEYRKSNWGRLFPGSTVDIYEWVESNLLPSQWLELSTTQQGLTLGISGTPKYGNEVYTQKNIFNATTGGFETRFYFWVKNKVEVPNLPDRNIPAVEIANIIEDPQAYGIKSIQILSKNAISVSNVKTTLDDDNVFLNIQYRNIDTDIPQHNEWQLIGENQFKKIDNEFLIKKLVDSITGYDSEGNPVPDTELPVQRKYGIQIRPRQSMFVDRLNALQTIITYTNEVMLKNRIVDTKNIQPLFEKDPIPTSNTGKWDISVDDVTDLDDIGTQDLEQASLTVILENGRIKSVTIDNPGFGYQNPPEIIISGNGSGAKLKATIDSLGRINNVTVIKTGSRYSFCNAYVRPFRVLVNVDSSANNNWAIYEWQAVTKLWSRANTQTYDLSRFWRYEDYIVDGYDVDTIIDYKLDAPYELNSINPSEGDIIRVENAGDGNVIILQKVNANGTFNNEYDVKYKENSTIQINTNIYNYEELNFGFAGLENYDANLFDSEPITETRRIIEIIRDNIFVDDLKDNWNKLFFVAIRHVFTEQSFVDWAFKSSFVSVNNKLGGLSKKLNYKVSNPGFVEEYIKEVKPYKTVLRNFVNQYESLETSNTGSTDFDLPSYWDDDQKAFVVPKITSDIITEQPYVNWFDNYKFKIGSISVTDEGAGYTEPPIVVISGGRTNKPTIAETAEFRPLVTTDYTDSRFFVKTTSIPDHGFARNPGVNTVTAQDFTFEITRTPVEALEKVVTPFGTIGVAVNGVVLFNPKAAQTEQRGNVDYEINAVFSHDELGIDDGSGHPQEDGVYHYHSDPRLMYEKDPTQHSPLLGYALDGFPIYGPYGWDSTTGRSNPRVMKSSYRLKTVTRADGSDPDGRYVQDYEYIAGLGDLDQHNGRTCNTPEYPNGTYAYFVTVDPTDTDVAVYPYIIGPTYYGAPILPNGNKTLPGEEFTDATAVAYTSRGIVREIVITNSGSGYVSAPTVTLAGGGGENAVTESAKAYAILENKKVRINTVNMKFDRISTKKLIQTQTQVDTFTASAGQIKFKLTYLPTLDKRKIDINIENETVYIENYEVSIVTVKDRTYKKQEGYIIFNTPPGANADVTITYEKSINLMQATDRIDYYYEPTSGMPGKEPEQLMTGVEYDGVQVQGLEFDISVGWDGLPWFSHGWDTFSGTNTDYAFRADGITTSFTLPYTPESGQEINVYFDGVRQDPTNTETIVGDGNTDTFNLSVTPGEGSPLDSEYNNGALIAENNGTVFDRALTVNGLKLVVAGAVGGQLAVPDEWAKKTARTFELMTDPNGAGINTTHQRNFIKTLKGDAGTYHAGIPTVQRVGYGGGSTYTPNWLEDAGIASYAGLQAFNDSVAQKDMVWYKNINGNNPPTQRRDIEEIFEHIFHTIHAFGIPGAVPGSSDAVEMNPDIRIGNEPSFDWQNTALHLAMKEAIDAGLYDPSGYAPDWNTDPEKAAVAYTEYTYLVNWSMWDMSVYWDGGSLSPEWDDSLKTPAGMLANNPLGYALFNTYFAPVLSKPNFATIESIFGENDTGVSGYVVDVISSGVTPGDGVLVVFRQKESDGSLVPTDVNNLDAIIQGGNFAYSTATGTNPEDVNIDGDGFVTPDTSHAPEEVVPGQCFDSLSISIYNSPADGSPLIVTNRYFGNSLLKRYAFDLYPGTNDSIFVTVAGLYLKNSTDYTVDYQNKEIVFVDAPEVGELITIQTLNVGGANILERKQFTGDGSTTEYELTTKYEDVGSAFVTSNGVSKEYVIRESDTGSAVIDISNPPPVSNAVIQITALSSTEKTYSEIVKESVIDDGSSTAYTMSNIPGNIAPYHNMVIAEVKDLDTGIITRLLPPDTVYYVSNGITQQYTVSQDPEYPTFALALGEIEVYLNGNKLVPIRDFNFDTQTNLVTFNQNVLTSGDVIAVTILRNHEYEINVTGDSADAYESNLIIVKDRAQLPTNAEYHITTFTNHDSNLIRKEVFTGKLGGTYKLSRPALNSNYVWVEIDGTPLVAERDYKILDNNTTVEIDDKFTVLSTSRVTITTFSEELSFNSIGYKVFNDMLNRTHFKRISEQDSTKLIQNLNSSDSEIVVEDASFFDTPSPADKTPGVVWIDRERIEFYKITGNKLQQITRGTLGTGIKTMHESGTKVFDAGPEQTVPYKETVNVYESIIRPGLPNGKQEHVLETVNISSSAEAHDQVEVYLAGRKLQKPTVSTNPIKVHDNEIAYDSNEVDSNSVSSDVIQQPEFTIEPVADSTGKNYYKLTLRDEPQDGLELKVVQRQGRVWYEQSVNTASNGATLQRAETAQAKFLLERTSGLPVINIRE